jgi:hypothetical protein
MQTLQERLGSQLPPNPQSDDKKPIVGGGAMQTLQVDAEVNRWTLVLAENKARRFLMIQNRGGDAGACNVDMVFDRQNRNDAFTINDFFPPIAPTNAIYVYVTDPYGTGSTSVNLQVIEG